MPDGQKFGGTGNLLDMLTQGAICFDDGFIAGLYNFLYFYKALANPKPSDPSTGKFRYSEKTTKVYYIDISMVAFLWTRSVDDSNLSTLRITSVSLYYLRGPFLGPLPHIVTCRKILGIATNPALIFRQPVSHLEISKQRIISFFYDTAHFITPILGYSLKATSYLSPN